MICGNADQNYKKPAFRIRQNLRIDGVPGARIETGPRNVLTGTGVGQKRQCIGQVRAGNLGLGIRPLEGKGA